MLNKKRSRQCRRIEVQSKETSTHLKCSLGNGEGRDAATRSCAASGRQPPMDWRGRSNKKQRLQADHATRAQESANFPLGGPEKLSGADGDIMCHPILVTSFLQEFDVADAKVGAERNSRKQKASTT